MAPAYRANGQSRRQNRTGYVDHDVFEGLPVRHWRRDYVTVAPAPTQESNITQNDMWAVELPYGMPKDSHLLPQHSQDLLRAARSGKIYKRPAPTEDEEPDAEAVLGDKPEKKEDDPREKGFTARAWKQVPRHQEGPDVEYLAKRRKGLVTVAAKSTTGPVLTKTTVRRTDAAGNEYVQDVVIPQGEQIEGEIIAQTTITDPNAATALIAPPAPPRRNKPITKKKLKGPGRGRKKIPVPPTSVPSTTNPQVEGQTGQSIPSTVGPDGVKIENQNGNVTDLTKNTDTEMADGSGANSEDDDGDDGEEGEIDEDDEGSPSMSQSPAKSTLDSPNPLNSNTSDIRMSGTESQGMATLDLERIKEDGKTGSPLKNVALTISNLNTPLVSPTNTPTNDPSPIEQMVVEPLAATTTTIQDIEEKMQEMAESSAPIELPPPPPEPTIIHKIAAIETRQEEEEEEEMLIDIVENANNVNIGADEFIVTEQTTKSDSETMPITEPKSTEVQTTEHPIIEPPAMEAITPPITTQSPEVTLSTSEEPTTATVPEVQIQKRPTPEATRAEAAPPAPALEPEPAQEPIHEEKPDFQDLLGGLERNLYQKKDRGATTAVINPDSPKFIPEIEEKDVETKEPRTSEGVSQESEMLLEAFEKPIEQDPEDSDMLLDVLDGNVTQVASEQMDAGEVIVDEKQEEKVTENEDGKETKIVSVEETEKAGPA